MGRFSLTSSVGSRCRASIWRFSARSRAIWSRAIRAPRAGLKVAQLPVDAVQHARPVERLALGRTLELGAQIEEMPPQPVHGPRPLGDEIVAMIEQQPNLHRLLVQIRDRELLDTVLDDRAGDRQRVDLVRLAQLALPLA